MVCTELGPPEKLQVQEREIGAPEAGHVVVRVHAAGVNFVDALMVGGQYQIRPQPPFVPGSEVAGVVEQVGEGATVEVGTRVVTTTPLNGFAEQVVVPAVALRPMPEGMDFPRAAAFPQSYMTALFALSRCGELAAGETVLVLGAGGGVGLAAVDVAHALGARVIAAASSEEKLDLCRKLGAEATINYSEEDLKLRAKELSGGGANVIYDPVGAQYADPALRAVAPEGRYLVIGFAGGEIPRVPFNLILLKRCRVIGVNWGGWSAEHRDENTALFDELCRLFEQHRIDPLPPTSYPLEQAGAALRALLDRKLAGKAVLVP